MENTSIKTNQILEAAKLLFTKYGYKRVSMDEIAREANVVKSTIYQHFKDKEELFKYFIYDEIKKMELMVNKIENESKSTFEIIHRTIYELLMYRNTQQFLITITKEAEDFNSVSLRNSLKMIDKSIVNYIEKRLEKGIEKKVIRKCNTQIMAFVMFKSYLALAIEWEKDNQPLNEKEISDNISLFLERGLLIKKGEVLNEKN